MPWSLTAICHKVPVPVPSCQLPVPSSKFSVAKYPAPSRIANKNALNLIPSKRAPSAHAWAGITWSRSAIKLDVVHSRQHVRGRRGEWSGAGRSEGKGERDLARSHTRAGSTIASQEWEERSRSQRFIASYKMSQKLYKSTQSFKIGIKIHGYIYCITGKKDKR